VELLSKAAELLEKQNIKDNLDTTLNGLSLHQQANTEVLLSLKDEIIKSEKKK
jgi:hypothetical protein